MNRKENNEYQYIEKPSFMVSDIGVGIYGKETPFYESNCASPISFD
jgi:hypothetical protein